MVPSHDERRTCLQDLIATAAEYWHRPYPLMFSQSWGASFRTPPAGDEPYTIGNCLDAQFDTAFEDLNVHHGIDIQLMQDPDSRQVLERVKTSLRQDTPVIVYIDQYRTPWLSAYGTYHREHYVLVTGIDVQGQALRCIDPVFSKSQESLPLADFLEGNNGGCGLIRLHDDTQDVDIPAWLERLRRKLWDAEHGSVFDALHRLADAVQDDRFDLKQEAALTPGQDIWLCPLLWHMIHLVKGRDCFRTSVAYIGEKYENRAFLRFNEELHAIVEAWAAIRDTSLKMVYMSRIPPGFTYKLADQLRRVAERERIAGETLLNDAMETLNRGKCHPRRQAQPQKNVEFVELTEYLNNNAFGDIHSGASFTWHEGNEHFLLEGMTDWTDYGMPAIAAGAEDNVSCLGQSLSVPVQRYHSIGVVGCSEREAVQEEVRVAYEDGSEQSLAVGLTYWGADRPAFGERIAWAGKSVSYGEGGPSTKEGRKIFELTVTIDSTRRLSGITLPFQPNMHIFAIQLYPSHSEGGTE